LLLIGVEFEFASNLVHGFATHFVDALIAPASGMLAVAAACGETAQNQGDGCEAHKAAFDPRFHDFCPFKDMLNIMLIMQIASAYWVSVRLRFISFCISQSLNYLRNLKVYMTSS
jgi:hypothetical protein